MLRDYIERYFAADLARANDNLLQQDLFSDFSGLAREANSLPEETRLHFCIGLFLLALEKQVLDQHSPVAFREFCRSLRYPEGLGELPGGDPVEFLKGPLTRAWATLSQLEDETDMAMGILARSLKDHWPAGGGIPSCLEGCLRTVEYLGRRAADPALANHGMPALMKSCQRRLKIALESRFHLKRRAFHDFCLRCAERKFRDWVGMPGMAEVPKIPEIEFNYCPHCGSNEKVNPEFVIWVPTGDTTGLPGYFKLAIGEAATLAGNQGMFGKPYRKLRPPPPTAV